jgi:RNA polymerase sigma factor (sigma-70 family)
LVPDLLHFHPKGVTMTFAATEEEWKKWQEAAEKIAYRMDQHTSLGGEAYAGAAIEKLLARQERPENVEAWLKKVITNMFIDRARKVKARKGASLRGLEDEEINQMATHLLSGDFTTQLAQVDFSREVLSELSDKEQQILVLSAGGWSNGEIAEEMGYAGQRAVSARLGKIQTKLQSKFTREQPKS